MWRERNNKLFRQKRGNKGADIGTCKEAVQHRLAKLKNVVKDLINMFLHSSWGLFESIFEFV